MISLSGKYFPVLCAIMCIGVNGCEDNASGLPTTPTQSSTDSVSGPKTSRMSVESEEVIRQKETALTEIYAKLCATVDDANFVGEPLEGEDYSILKLKEFRLTNKTTEKFARHFYPANADFNGNGIEDFYLIIPGYNYSSFRKDYTELFIIPGRSGGTGEPEPNFESIALKRTLFSNLNRHTFRPRNTPNIEREGEFIMTAKVTPIRFKSEVYIKVEAQTATAQKPVYRSAYLNAPDWTTYARINHRLEVQPICQ